MAKRIAEKEVASVRLLTLELSEDGNYRVGFSLDHAAPRVR